MATDQTPAAVGSLLKRHGWILLALAVVLFAAIGAAYLVSGHGIGVPFLVLAGFAGVLAIRTYMGRNGIR